MELNNPTLEDKKGMYAFFFESDAGEMFRGLIKDMHEGKLNLAQSVYLHNPQPTEQIATIVSQATGLKEVLDFIDSIEKEVKEAKKEEGDQ